MPEDKKPKKDEEVKDAMASMSSSEHSMSLPKKDKSKKVWIVLFVITLLALIGLGVYGYTKVQSDNKKIKDQQAQIDDLQNKKKTLEETAAAAKTATSTNQLTVKELNFSFTANPSLVGLTYMYVGANNSVTFSTSPIISALNAVPDGKGNAWQPGYLVSTYKVKKTEANSVSKDLILADLGDSYLVNLPAQNGPESQPGFGTYAQLKSVEAPILLNSLKTAKPL
jgi:cell division protein FtsB